jgi:hypothetical protein
MSRRKKPATKLSKKKKPSSVPRKPDGKIDWAKYNKQLGERGNIILWIDTEVVSGWADEPKIKSRGGQKIYSDDAIGCVLMVRSVFHLALRQAERFCRSFFKATKVDLPVPNFSTLSRRCGKLDVPLPRVMPKGPIHVLVDSTGIKVYGEGEWKVRQHGIGKRRTWLKMHVAIDAMTQEVVASVISSASVSDDEAFDHLIDQIEGDLASVGGDGAYDKAPVRETIEKRGADPRIPPRKDAKPQKKPAASELRKRALDKRDEAIRRIEQLQKSKTRGDLSEARKYWKREIHYHQRSKVETTMYRYKTIFGPTVRARTFNNQTKEICLNLAALNRMTALGIPSTLTAA